MAVAQFGRAIDTGRTLGAARYVANRMATARSLAALRSVNVALRFDGRDGGATLGTVVDGNRNGVRTADLAAGVDTAIDQPIRIAELFPGVTLSLDPDDTAPAAGTFSLMSFSPVGTATSGTVYLRGRGGARFGVRVFGPTARTRLLRVDPRTGELVERLF